MPSPIYYSGQSEAPNCLIMHLTRLKRLFSPCSLTYSIHCLHPNVPTVLD